MRMKLLPLAGILTLAVAAVPAYAQAPQTELKASAKISPTKVGTKKKPAGVKLSVNVNLDTAGDGEKPVMTSGNIYFPKGSLYNGKKFTKCSYSILAKKGLDGCPAKSIMGTGSADALADTVPTTPKLTVVNLGAKDVCIWTVLTNPARVSACVTGTITKPGGKWAYKLAYKVPQNLQVVAGVPIAVQSLKITAGKKSYAKTWLATTSCPASKKFPYRVEVQLDNGQSPSFDGTTPCKR